MIPWSLRIGSSSILGEKTFRFRSKRLSSYYPYAWSNDFETMWQIQVLSKPVKVYRAQWSHLYSQKSPSMKFTSEVESYFKT